MSLSYRAFIEVPADTDAVALAAEQFRSWLRGKHSVRVHDWDGPGLHQVGPDAWLTVIEHEGEDRTRLLRLRLAESNATGDWAVTLTAATRPKNRDTTEQFIWVDVDSPEETSPDGTVRARWAATPKLISGVLACTEARDSLVALTDRPLIVRGDDRTEIDPLIDAICDPDRNVGLVIAGAVPGVPVNVWHSVITSLLRESVGMAAAYVLDEAAHAALNRALTDTHAIPAGGVRTFLPGADPADPVDARRHRILTPRTIESALTANMRVSGSLSRLLARTARTRAIEQPLPKVAQRADRILSRLETDVVLEHLSTLPTTVRPAADADAAPAPIAVTVTPVLDEPTAEPSPPASGDATTPAVPGATDAQRTGPSSPAASATVGEQAEEYLLLRNLVISLLDVETVTPEAVEQVRLLAQQGQSAAVRQGELSRRLSAAQDRIERLEDAQSALTRALEDEQLEHAESQQETLDLRDNQVRLQRELARLGAADIAWTDVPDEERLKPPTSLADLLERLEELPHVEFTGDPKPALDLDERDTLGVWASKAWQALVALEDYAQARLAEEFKHGVHAYLKDTPPGRRGFSDKAHAPDESDTVKRNGKFRESRCLPVPTTVDPSGEVFMGAHFKVATRGTVSPRLHYHDDVQHTGKVYVGYLGRHLPNTKTN